MAERKLAAALAAALLVGLTGTAIGADSTISTVKGAKYKMADAVIADRVTRITEAGGDQRFSDGTPATEAPPWTDISRVHVATAKTPAKLRSKMKAKHPPGASDAFYGSVARPRVDERIIFVAVEMARKLPASARSQLVEVGLGGIDATPVQVGTELDTRAGVESFSLSGRFKNGAIATGDTNVVGKEPGTDLEDADYYNEESGVYGFYEPRKATWYLAIPRDSGVDDITVSVRSTTSGGQVIDRLELPGGGYFIDLKDTTGGYKQNAGVPALACRAIETFSGEGGVIELTDIDATLVRYTAGVDTSIGGQKRGDLLAAADAAAGPVSVVLTPVGSDEEPLSVPGELSITPQDNAVQLTFEAPAGQWRFALEQELMTPAGELYVDHSSLTGPAGVLTGPGLDGLAAGDLSCTTPEGTAAAEDVTSEEAASDEVAEPEA